MSSRTSAVAQRRAAAAGGASLLVSSSSPCDMHAPPLRKPPTLTSPSLGRRDACLPVMLLWCRYASSRARPIAASAFPGGAAPLAAAATAAGGALVSQRRAYASRDGRSSSASVPEAADPFSSAAAFRDDDADDWSAIEVEVLMPEPEPAAAGAAALGGPGFSDAGEAAAAAAAAGGPTEHGSSGVMLETIEVVDPYAKAKVGNFVRRLLQPSAGGVDGLAGAASPSSSSGAAGLEVREVQGGGRGGPQYHARWRLPLPPEFGERYGEGFAATAKEAEMVAAMHAERVIDALGFPLFQLTSKQRKHAEAALAAGRWAPMPAPAPGTAASTSAAAEVVPPPDTPSPPPLQLQTLTAQQRQAKQLCIERVQFTPVQHGGMALLQHTLASPHFLDGHSYERIFDFFKAARTSLAGNLKLVLLRGSAGGDFDRDGGGGSRRTAAGDRFLAQLTLPLPIRFGKRLAMGKAPTRKEAVFLACMHAELIIDAVGFPLYPKDAKAQAAHAAECARVRRWCAPPGNTTFHYNVASPPPLQLVERVDEETVAASASGGGVEEAEVVSPVSSTDAARAANQPQDPGGAVGHAAGQQRSRHEESIIAQHQRVTAEARYFVEEQAPREYGSAKLLLERYIEQFVVAPPAGAAPVESPLMSFMFVEELGQRDRPVFRATITVPLTSSEVSQPGAPLLYTTSFVALGVSYTSALAQTAASVHALRTLAALNRLTLMRGSPAVVQALESLASRARMSVYDAAQPMLDPSQVPRAKLPMPVRIMDGFVGRIAGAGLRIADRRRDARDGAFGRSVERNKESVPVLSAPSRNGTVPLNRDDHMLRQLRETQERLPRLDWDTTPDIDDRIIVPPDQDVERSRMYVHTLSSVRQPDATALLRLRDYLERYGKSIQTSVRITRVPLPHERGAPDKAGDTFVFRATVPLPLTLRHRALSHLVAGAGPTGDDAAAAAAGDGGGAGAAAATGDVPALPAYVAHGEAPTREDAVLLCAVHAELLLDAAGQAMYDHGVLQRKHADTARSLGRWAPLVRGAIPPTSLCRLPPPLLKVAGTSGIWARVQAARRAASGPASGGEASSAANAAGASVQGDGEEAAAAVDDEALCDISRMQYVHRINIGQSPEKHVGHFFENNHSDLYRVVRQYKVRHPEHGTVFRAIAEMPLAAVHGKHYAVGCGATRLQALRLCCRHAMYILEALHIPIFRDTIRQRRYTKSVALQGREVWNSHKATTGAVPTPPGLFYLPTCASANMESLVIPRFPPIWARHSTLLWNNYTNMCSAYTARVAEALVTEALTAADGPVTPRSRCVAEDATLDVADKMRSDKLVRRQLRHGCRAERLPDSAPRDLAVQSSVLGPRERGYYAASELRGTPYVMRGISRVSAADCRHRTYQHGVQLLQHVVRSNASPKPMPRLYWYDGPRRQLRLRGVLDSQPTPQGCLWMLRLWSAMHYPPRRVCVSVRAAGEVQGRVGDDAEGAPAATEAPDQDTERPLPVPTRAVYVGDAAVVEFRDAGNGGSGTAAEKALFRAAFEAVGARGDSTALSAMHGAVVQLLRSVRRVPTMQSLENFLAFWPQLHVPSLRVLPDPDEVVPRLCDQVCGAASAAGSGADASSRHGRADLGALAGLLHGTQQLCPEPFYVTWPVLVLQQWVRDAAVASGADVEARFQPLPRTLVAPFTLYELARARPTAGSGAVRGRQPPDVLEPTQLAVALAVLVGCLPPPPPSTTCDAAVAPAAVPGLAAAAERVERARMLPLQLAHLVLMGLLLGCGPWAVRAAAMVACTEDTLRWHDELSQRSQRRTGTGASASEAAAPLPKLPAAFSGAAAASASDAPHDSVDLADAVLTSLDPAAPPLPESVTAYAAAVQQRLAALWSQTSAAAVGVQGVSPLPWMPPPESWRACLGEVPGAAPADSVAATFPQRRALRPLLQCAVVASCAADGVWVRATGDAAATNEVDGAAEAQLVFQHRRVAHYAAVHVSARDLTQLETVESLADVSAAAACFASFGCAVYAVEPVRSITWDEENVRTHRSAQHYRSVLGMNEVSAESPSPSGSKATAEQDAYEGGDVRHVGGEDEHGARKGENGDNEGDEEHEEEDEEEEEGGLAGAGGDSPVHLFARCLGVSVSPLAAALVGAAAAASLDTPGSALCAVGEHMPMMLLAFDGTVPVVLHRHSSVPALGRLAVHLRSRVASLTPFSTAERRALTQLLSLPLRPLPEGGDWEVEDAAEEAEAEEGGPRRGLR